ncbi:MAG: flagellar motor protein MotB [Ignavibacteriota bacterium]
MTLGEDRPIIIVRKAPPPHEIPHGGAWKVAYADFVTAMMALFIVLWLMNSNAKVQEAVSGYFRDPAGVGTRSGIASHGTDKTVELSKDPMLKLKQELERTIKNLARFQAIKNQVAFSITSEGIRIELLETEKGLFFETGSPKPSEAGVDLLQTLATELGKHGNRLTIEGHTDATPYRGKGLYSNWELSSDRANQARQLMQANGLRADQVAQVRGYADQQLRNPSDPQDPSNRRITLIVLNAPDGK